MGNLTIATIFIVFANVLMWFSQIAMISVNPDGSVCYHIEGSVIEQNIQRSANASHFGNINYSILQNNILDDLPSAEGTISPSNSNGFTDIFNNILSWFKGLPGVKYVYGVVAAPYNILKCMNVPNEFVIGVGTIWYMVSLLVLVGFLWGRE